MPADPLGPARADPPRVTMQGLTLNVPNGWEVRIRQSAQVAPDETHLPVLHASTEPLPAERADYGGGVVERLKNDSVFISLLEFGDEAVGSKLYPVVQSIPRVTASQFHPFQLQRRIVGQAGSQTFFTFQDRAFCLYVVLGSFARRIELSARANQLIDQLLIAPRS